MVFIQIFDTMQHFTMYKKVNNLSKIAQKYYDIYLYFINDNILFWNSRNNITNEMNWNEIK